VHPFVDCLRFWLVAGGRGITTQNNCCYRRLLKLLRDFSVAGDVACGLRVNVLSNVVRYSTVVGRHYGDTAVKESHTVKQGVHLLRRTLRG
jgi:hypothetical protein